MSQLSPEHGEVSLSNGKIVYGHLSRELKRASFDWKEGGIVLLEMTIYDFDKARITGYKEN